MVEIPAGHCDTRAFARSSRHFGWDNEYEAHTIAVPAFSIDQYEVTNREYLQFMNAGGYENRALWNEADWNWKTRAKHFTSGISGIRSNGDWRYRTMFENIPLPLDWPVYVSHAEASAYARWAGKALPTEAQWHRAAYGTPEGPSGSIPGALKLPTRGWETSISSAGIPRRSELSLKARALLAWRPDWKRMGVDGDAVRPVSGVRAVFVLSRLLGQFLRWSSTT